MEYIKNTVVDVPFFINKNNQQYLLKGMKIENFEEEYNSIFETNSKVYVYMPREDTEYSDIERTQYPDSYDVIVAEAVGIYTINNEIVLRIKLIDSLYYSKLCEPCIRINGFCTINSESIHIDEVTRLTLSNRKSQMLMSSVL